MRGLLPSGRVVMGTTHAGACPSSIIADEDKLQAPVAQL